MCLLITTSLRGSLLVLIQKKNLNQQNIWAILRISLNASWVSGKVITQAFVVSEILAITKSTFRFQYSHFSTLLCNNARNSRHNYMLMLMRLIRGKENSTEEKFLSNKPWHENHATIATNSSAVILYIYTDEWLPSHYAQYIVSLK